MSRYIAFCHRGSILKSRRPMRSFGESYEGAKAGVRSTGNRVSIFMHQSSETGLDRVCLTAETIAQDGARRIVTHRFTDVAMLQEFLSKMDGATSVMVLPDGDEIEEDAALAFTANREDQTNAA